MARHLNLVESDFEKLEKRVLPRFPFCYLTFKSENSSSRVFEVKDISHSGMQLALRAESSEAKQGDDMKGEIHWHGKSLRVAGTVKWSKEKRLGVEFANLPKLRKEVDQFLEIEHFSQSLNHYTRPNWD